MKKAIKYIALVLVIVLIAVCLTGCGSKTGKSSVKFALKKEYTENDINEFAKGLEKSEDIKRVSVQRISRDGHILDAYLWVEAANGKEIDVLASFLTEDGKHQLHIRDNPWSESSYDRSLYPVIEQVEKMLGGESKFIGAEKNAWYTVGKYTCDLHGYWNDVDWYIISIHI